MTPAEIWYGSTASARLVSALLAPLGWLYCGAAMLRAGGYRLGLLRSFAAGAPVIVVGNLSVGGTGKTPLVGWLAGYLGSLGLRPGIATRGYGAERGSATGQVSFVPIDADPTLFGDEPALLAASAVAPVAMGRDRVAAARALVRERGCDLVITDDGLQHYRLQREIEILVADASRGHGNGRCLPAGPLREPISRAARADLQVATGGGLAGMHDLALVPDDAVSLMDSRHRRALETFIGTRVRAVAGIGNPGRFFAMLRAGGLDVREHPYPDHHRFTLADVREWGRDLVLMTEKDAIKCRRLQTDANLWSVPVTAAPSKSFVTALGDLLQARAITSATTHRS